MRDWIGTGSSCALLVQPRWCLQKVWIGAVPFMDSCMRVPGKRSSLACLSLSCKRSAGIVDCFMAVNASPRVESALRRLAPWPRPRTVLVWLNCRSPPHLFSREYFSWKCLFGGCFARFRTGCWCKECLLRDTCGYYEVHIETIALRGRGHNWSPVLGEHWQWQETCKFARGTLIQGPRWTWKRAGGSKKCSHIQEKPSKSGFWSTGQPISLSSRRWETPNQAS